MIQAQRTSTLARFVAYIRVSTTKQGTSGLGLEAQQSAVMEFVSSRNGELLRTFTEVESGKRNERPQLADALRLCRLQSAVLVIAKLDRLARNVAFISHLMESKIDFVAVDFPEANRLTIHILAAVAEHEAEMISMRTRSALGAAKARGVVLGTPRNLRNRQLGTVRSATVRQRDADDRARDLRVTLEEIKTEGARSLREIGDALEARAIRPVRGQRWSATQVNRLLKRVQNIDH